jgi:hypothetical protein
VRWTFYKDTFSSRIGADGSVIDPAPSHLTPGQQRIDASIMMVQLGQEKRIGRLLSQIAALRARRADDASSARSQEVHNLFGSIDGNQVLGRHYCGMAIRLDRRRKGSGSRDSVCNAKQ